MLSGCVQRSAKELVQDSVELVRFFHFNKVARVDLDLFEVFL